VERSSKSVIRDESVPAGFNEGDGIIRIDLRNHRKTLSPTK